MGKRGPPPLEPTKQMRASVLAMAGFGIPADEIARAMLHPVTGKPISETTLKKFFAYELSAGTGIMKHKVVGFLARMATGINGSTPQAVTAAIYLTKARWGWRDRPVDGVPADSAGEEIKITGGLPNEEGKS